MMITKIIQANLNRSWGALDLFKQYMLEKDVSIGLISKPPVGMSETNSCFISRDDLAAIIWIPEACIKTCRLIKRGESYVIICAGDFYVISSYISPNVHIVDFTNLLDDLTNSVSLTSGLFLIGGDFNAWSTLWGSSYTDRRREHLERWAAALDARLLNTYGVFTCLRPQGSSIIDLTWVSPLLLERVRDWSVLEDAEPLSDHLYILVTIEESSSIIKSNVKTHKRWNFKKLDDELFIQVMQFTIDIRMPDDCLENPEKYAAWVIDIVSGACDVAAPIVFSRNKRRQVYWWSEEISALRRASIRARRLWTKARHKVDEVDIYNKMKEYRLAKRTLRLAIKKAKGNTWTELIDSINRDPWGLPYKIVMGKLRRSCPALTETLDQVTLNKLLGTLFPGKVSLAGKMVFLPLEWKEEMDVDILEVINFLKKRPARNSAPGPDNLKATLWKKVPNVIYAHIAEVFTLCFRKGIFSGCLEESVTSIDS